MGASLLAVAKSIYYCVLQHNHVYKVVLTQEIKIHVRIDLYYGHIKIYAIIRSDH